MAMLDFTLSAPHKAKLASKLNAEFRAGMRRDLLALDNSSKAVEEDIQECLQEKQNAVGREEIALHAESKLVSTYLHGVTDLIQRKTVVNTAGNVSTGSGCPLLNKLPPEVRNRIWSELLYRPIAIEPSTVRYTNEYFQSKPQSYEIAFPFISLFDAEDPTLFLMLEYLSRTSMSQLDRLVKSFKSVDVSSYKFEDKLRTIAERRGVKWKNNDDMNQGDVKISWQSRPTKEQLAVIDKAAWEVYESEADPPEGDDLELPSYYDSELGTRVSCFYLDRFSDCDNLEPGIINRATVRAVRLEGASILRTCKLIHEEASEILYGKNNFVFSTCNNWEQMRMILLGSGSLYEYDDHFLSSTRKSVATTSIHLYNTFEGKIPGRRPPTHPNDDDPDADEKDEEAINELFDLMIQKDGFLAVDPFLMFCSKIGRKNSSRLAHIKLEGTFKTASTDNGKNPMANIGFSRLLPVYTKFITKVCISLNSLILHQGENAKYWGWDHWTEVEGDEKFNDIEDETRLMLIADETVYGLSNHPKLEILQLGDYYFTPDKVKEYEWHLPKRYELLFEEDVLKRKEGEVIEE